MSVRTNNKYSWTSTNGTLDGTIVTIDNFIPPTYTGRLNTAFGKFSMGSNVQGNNNTVVGQRLLSMNTLGCNTAIGYSTLDFNVTSASATTAIGHRLFNSAAGNGMNNVFIGTGDATNVNSAANGRTVIATGTIDASAPDTVYLGSDSTNLMRMTLPTYSNANNTFVSVASGAWFRQGKSILYYVTSPASGTKALYSSSYYPLYVNVPSPTPAFEAVIPSIIADDFITVPEYAWRTVAQFTASGQFTTITTPTLNVNCGPGSGTDEAWAQFVLARTGVSDAALTDVWGDKVSVPTFSPQLFWPATALEGNTQAGTQGLATSAMSKVERRKAASISVNQTFNLTLGDTYYLLLVLKFIPNRVTDDGILFTINGVTVSSDSPFITNISMSNTRPA
jgi:hypothetical protein